MCREASDAIWIPRGVASGRWHFRRGHKDEAEVSVDRNSRGDRVLETSAGLRSSLQQVQTTWTLSGDVLRFFIRKTPSRGPARSRKLFYVRFRTTSRCILQPRPLLYYELYLLNEQRRDSPPFAIVPAIVIATYDLLNVDLFHRQTRNSSLIFLPLFAGLLYLKSLANISLPV